MNERPPEGSQGAAADLCCRGMDRRTRARDLVRAALDQVEGELAQPRHNLCADQLGACRSALRGYLAALEGDSLPPRRDRCEDLCRMILDSWPYDLPIGNAILQAERAWRNC